MAFLQANWHIIVGVLFAVSELLAQIPSLKANSVFQLVVGLVKSLKQADDKAVAKPEDKK